MRRYIGSGIAQHLVHILLRFFVEDCLEYVSSFYALLILINDPG